MRLFTNLLLLSLTMLSTYAMERENEDKICEKINHQAVDGLSINSPTSPEITLFREPEIPYHLLQGLDKISNKDNKKDDVKESKTALKEQPKKSISNTVFPAIYKAIDNNDLDTLTELLKLNIQMSSFSAWRKENKKLSPLGHAINIILLNPGQYKQRKPIIETLLKRPFLLTNQPELFKYPGSNSYTNWPILYAAVAYEHYDLAKTLLENGVSPQCSAPGDETPLHFACWKANNWKPNEDMIQLLLNYYANVNVRSSDGDTPLHYALITGAPDRVIELLLKKGADPHIKNKQGRSAQDLIDERNSCCSSLLACFGGCCWRCC